jgi:hypothetical protein
MRLTITFVATVKTTYNPAAPIAALTAHWSIGKSLSQHTNASTKKPAIDAANVIRRKFEPQ